MRPFWRLFVSFVLLCVVLLWAGVMFMRSRVIEVWTWWRRLLQKSECWVLPIPTQLDLGLSSFECLAFPPLSPCLLSIPLIELHLAAYDTPYQYNMVATDQPPTAFQSRVYDVVRTIPKGKVRTYGSIAKGEERRFAMHFVRQKNITIMPCSLSYPLHL